jgi:hypothetical protein
MSDVKIETEKMLRTELYTEEWRLLGCYAVWLL